MKWLERLILVAGLATVGLLLWRFDARAVWGMISQVGLLGFLAILAFQIFDHLLNAFGWRFAFSPEDAPKAGLPLLIKARIAGDGVNYLTPSGTIAGELIRPGMLGGILPEEVKNSSVIVAKFSQSMAQAFFILFGMLFVLHGKLNFLAGPQWALGLGGALVIIAAVGCALWVLTAETTPAFVARFQGLDALRGRMRVYLRTHPGRYVASILCFMAGYAWGAAETMLICHFMRIPISPLTALAAEILSNVIDALMFMVPAKMGTQEAGKTAIFHGLGYQASQGLAFGLIRHIREFCWAALGFAFYAVNRRSQRPPDLPASPRPSAAPL